MQEVFSVSQRLSGVQRWSGFRDVRKAHLLEMQQHRAGVLSARGVLEVALPGSSKRTR